MSEPEQREEAVFEAALRLAAHDRPAYLEHTCAGDPKRAARGSFAWRLRSGRWFPERTCLARFRENRALSSRPPRNPATRSAATSCSQKIGEGGCGVVYVAEQEEPVRRRVALKVIKLGMDTKQVVARFEAERQALALMDHPNIAKVLDAGRHRHGPALLRHGTGARDQDHRVLRPEPTLAPTSGSTCSSRSARPSSTRIKRGSSTATSSPRISWSRCTTACRCPR